MRPGRQAPTAAVRSGAWWRSRVGQPLDGCRAGHPRGVGDREGSRRHHYGQTFPPNRRAALGKEAAECALVGVNWRAGLRLRGLDVNLDAARTGYGALGIGEQDRERECELQRSPYQRERTDPFTPKTHGHYCILAWAASNVACRTRSWALPAWIDDAVNGPEAVPASHGSPVKPSRRSDTRESRPPRLGGLRHWRQCAPVCWLRLARPENPFPRSGVKRVGRSVPWD